MAKVSLENLEKRRRLYVARLRVPADVRTALGKSVFSWSTGEADPHRAAVKAKPVIAGWKQQIEEARRGNLTPAQREVRRLQAAYRTATRQSPQDGTDFLTEKVVPWVISHLMPGVSDEALEEAWEENDRDMYYAIKAVAPDAAAALDVIADARTPFLEHVEAWTAALSMRDRQRDEYRRDVDTFGSGRFVEDVTGPSVQAWVEERVRAGDSTATVQRRLSAIRNYWGYLQAHGHVSEEARPFDRRRIPNTGAKRDKRMPWTPAEVVRLHAAALEDGDTALADLIHLAAYTGARLEELCALDVSRIVWEADDGGPAMRIEDAKTEAGNRTVPMHSALVPVVRRLVENAQAGRWLIHSTADNKYGDRSPPLGKRFTRLKTALGFKAGKVFHSFRKTVATLLEDVGCPEGVAADLIGHEKPNITYGLYSGGAALATRREWLEKAIRYPGARAV